ncbi:sialidase family protein [Actinoplanes sp. NPDC051494]|uniref:sialidase family protein n=1 Tax=Actinoplanes sp. NPDC051494 TaxID=3363907 RepID=UPI0037B1847B
MLVPEGGCARGIGTYANGYRDVGANWLGTEVCDRLRLDPAPDAGGIVGAGGTVGDGPPDVANGWRGGGISAQAVAVEPDGALLTADDTGLARYRDGKREQLARSELSTEGFEGQGTRSMVRGLAVTGSGVIVLDAGLSTAARTAPALLLSTDRGRTLRRVDLPIDPDRTILPDGTREVVGVIAAAGDTIVAIGTQLRRATVWRSADGGDTWAVSSIDGLPGNTQMMRLVRAGAHWIALAGVASEGAGRQDTTFVLTSDDARHWAPGDMRGLGEGRIWDATVDAAGDVVMVGVTYDYEHRDGDLPPDPCGVVWTGDGDGPWKRGGLGCGDSPPQAVTTLRDGRVLIAGNRDLWLRPA